MILYVESNWVLEVVLHQDIFSPKFLEWAKLDHINLCLPVISIIEPYETLNRRIKDREQLSRDYYNKIEGSIHNVELPEYKSLHDTLIKAMLELKIVNTKTIYMLERTLTDILAHAEILPLSQQIYAKGLQAQNTHDELEQLDALIYASVLDHARNHPTAPKCFYEPDKHFSTQTLIDELKACGTKLFFESEHCLKYIEHELGL